MTRLRKDEYQKRDWSTPVAPEPVDMLPLRAVLFVLILSVVLTSQVVVVNTIGVIVLLGLATQPAADLIQRKGWL